MRKAFQMTAGCLAGAVLACFAASSRAADRYWDGNTTDIDGA
jgi:hypothetical protein